MRTDKGTIAEMEKLLEEYDIEVETKRKKGFLKNQTARTYLAHAENFVKWCKGEFIPGIRKLR
jgi:hypothetical protein